MHEQTHTSRRAVRASPRRWDLQGRPGVRVVVPSSDPSPRHRHHSWPPEPERSPPPAAPAAFSCLEPTRSPRPAASAAVSWPKYAWPLPSLAVSLVRVSPPSRPDRPTRLRESASLDLRPCASLDRGRLHGALEASATVASNQTRSERK
jgi:hypothetical protein